MSRRLRLGAAAALAAAAVVVGILYISHRPATVALTGIVTTDDVVVSVQVAGQLDQLLVEEGSPVEKGQLLAVVSPAELAAEASYYDNSAQALTSQVAESEAALRFTQRHAAGQLAQASSTLAALQSQAQAAAAEASNAQLAHARAANLAEAQLLSRDQVDRARTAYLIARGHADSLDRQVDAQRASVDLAKAHAEEVIERRSQVQSARHLADAAQAQQARAAVKLQYAEISAPIAGVVDVRAVRAGEYVAAGQAVMTLLDLDDLWVRLDVAETYIDRIRLGDALTVRLPSGAERQATVYFRGVNGGWATERNANRVKRDMRSFQVRLRIDNSDRRLAVGMTAYVDLPPAGD